jgi:YHS domain-containing protein
MKPIQPLLAVFTLAFGFSPSARAETAPSTAPAAATAKTLVNTNAKGLALQGYDPVAYFTEKKPVKGLPALSATFDGATYHFANAAHRDLFAQEPARYAPAFGGYCGYAASIGKVRPVKPEHWSIVDERLILQHSQGAVELWEKDIPGNRVRADRFWPRLVEVKAGKKDPVDGLFGASVLPEVR